MTTAQNAGAADLGHPDTCGLFQPLFRCGTGGAAVSSGSAANDPEVMMEQARQKGFQNGLKSGCEEAHCLARASLRPSLTAFMNSLESLSSQNQQIEDCTGTNVVELTLAIVEKILGGPASITHKDMIELKRTITTAMNQANRLSLNLHPDDASELKAILSADEAAWPTHPEIAIKNNPSLQNGELRTEEHTSLRESIDLQAKQCLSDALAGLSDSAS